MISIAQKLRAARARSGLSQEALARAAGVMQAQISLYERGIVRPSDAMAERILRAARPQPEVALERSVDRVLELAGRHGMRDVRIADDEGECVLIVAPGESASPLAFITFAVAVEDVLDYPIRVLDASDPDVPGATALIERARPLGSGGPATGTESPAGADR
ncbi:helix-turn-helix domain-containing protein [Planctomonas psychrotolerans]|uniref:helix-turn-helix domain-containing protein n=1 Tax=Planctomonas psychrotolerans TaxID=2528712 RepID=UPI001D0D0988|nr:helix-turn-helix transcriptional regulator [Planctomonas psychrotolerans]